MKRKASEARLTRSIRIREQRGELETWTPPTKSWLQDKDDRELLRRKKEGKRG